MWQKRPGRNGRPLQNSEVCPFMSKRQRWCKRSRAGRPCVTASKSSVCTSRLHAEHVTRHVTAPQAEREGAASIRARDPSTASTLPHPAPPPALALPALCLQQPCSLDATHVSQHDAPTAQFFIACGGPRVCEHTSMARLGFEPRACSFPFGGIILLLMIVDIVQVRSSRAIAAVCRTPRHAYDRTHALL